MNDYIIPANAKKGMLIFNMFRGVDLIILGTGVTISFLLLFVISGDSLLQLVIKLFPALISCLLVFPIACYHNVLVFLKEVFSYLFNQKIYIWRGWCVGYESESEK